MWFEVNLTIGATRPDGVVVVEVSGEVDVYTAGELRDSIDGEITVGHVRLVLDLTHVSFIDSTGLGVLVGRLKLVRDRAGILHLVCRGERVLKIMQITGLDKVFTIHDTQSAAIAAVAMSAPTA